MQFPSMKFPNTVVYDSSLHCIPKSSKHSRKAPAALIKFEYGCMCMYPTTCMHDGHVLRIQKKNIPMTSPPSVDYVDYVPCHHSHLSPSKLNSRTKVSQPLKRRHVAAPCWEPCQKNLQVSSKPHIPRKPFHTRISTSPIWSLTRLDFFRSFKTSLVRNPLPSSKWCASSIPHVSYMYHTISHLITKSHKISQGRGSSSRHRASQSEGS